MGSGSSVEKLVTIDFGGDAHGAVMGRLNADNLALAMNLDITRTCDLLGQSDNKVDRAANFELHLSQKIEAAVADVAGLRGEFQSLGIPRKNTHGQTHVETASFAAA